MSDVTEVILSSDGSGQMWNASMWDPSNGTSLMSYKGGGVSAPRSLCLLGNDYLLAAEHTKPMLHAWLLNSQEPVNFGAGRMLCAGCVTALAVSPSGHYCVAGIAERLYIWQLSSGRLRAVASRHFQDITCVKFTDDGSHIVSGGEDCRVIVWSLAYLISQFASEIFSVPGEADPRYTFFDHSLPVKDIFVGPGGIRAMLVSVSLDRTCKIYDLASGKMLLSLIFDSPLTAVTVDHTDTLVFVGTSGGGIHEFELRNPPREVQHVVDTNKTTKKFIGHEKAITCLSTSLDSQTVLSGSADTKVIIWDIPSGQCKRVLQHKGPVYNAFFTVAPKHVFSEDWKPSVVLKGFCKNIEGELNSFEVMTTVDLDESVVSAGNLEHTDFESDSGLKVEVASLKKINTNLYNFAVNNILKPFEDKNLSNLVNESVEKVPDKAVSKRKKRKSK